MANSNKRSRDAVRAAEAKAFFDNDLLPSKMEVDTSIIKNLSLKDLYHPSDSKDDNLAIPLTKMSEYMLAKIDKATDKIDTFLSTKGEILTFADVEEDSKDILPYILPREHKERHNFIDITTNVIANIYDQYDPDDKDMPIYMIDGRLDTIYDLKAISTIQSMSDYRSIEAHMQSNIAKYNFERKSLTCDLLTHILQMKEILGLTSVAIYFSRSNRKEDKFIRIIVEYRIDETTVFMMCEGFVFDYNKPTEIPDFVKESEKRNNRFIIRDQDTLSEIPKMNVTFCGYCYLFCECTEVTGIKK
jgi:hypothetical protein